MRGVAELTVSSTHPHLTQNSEETGTGIDKVKKKKQCQGRRGVDAVCLFLCFFVPLRKRLELSYMGIEPRTVSVHTCAAHLAVVTDISKIILPLEKRNIYWVLKTS